MKIKQLTKGVLTALVLISPIVGAEEYPAANFEPKVIYSDTDYKHSASSSSKTASTSKSDAKYPAANFKPEVIFSDSDYKHNQTPAKTSSSKKVTKSEAVVAEVSEDIVEESEVSSDDSMVTLFGLGALAVVGFLLFNKKSFSCPKKSASTADTVAAAPKKNANPSGLTGVALYLNKKMPEMSSVAKYLENKEKVPTSGVSKYMARKIVAAKIAAVTKTTGVEKYLRNKG